MVSENLKLSEAVLEELLNLYHDIKELSDEELLSSSSDRAESLFLKLDLLITQNLKSEVISPLLNKQELAPVFAHINRFRNLYTVRLETCYSNEILASQQPWDILEKFPFYRNYIKLVQAEYEGFELKYGDKVIFLGSGPLPLTLIVFFKLHGVKGTGIEQDPLRAQLSIRTLGKLGLSENITIINGNHLSLDLADFTSDTGAKAFMIAAQVEPKNQILEYLLKIIPAGCKISYRIYEKGLMKLLNQDFLLDLPEGYREYKRIRPEPPAYNTVVFLERIEFLEKK